MIAGVKILLIQLRRIGDVLMTTPAIKALRNACPEAHISFLTEAPSDQLLRYNPWLDEVLCFPKGASITETLKLYQTLRERKYDHVVDFQGNARTALMTLFTGASMRIGFNFKGRSWAYHQRVDLASSSYSAHDKGLLLRVLGVEVDNYNLEMQPGSADQAYAAKLFNQLGIGESEFTVSLSPVSRQPYKIWPTENYALLADWLIEHHQAKVIFLYGPGERHFADEVREKMSMQALPDFGVPDLLQTRAILEGAKLHLGNDNGLRHLAIAAGIPTVAVFGKPWAANWTPPGQTLHHAVEHDPGCKSRCTYPRCQHLNCIRGVKVDSVLNVLKMVVEKVK